MSGIGQSSGGALGGYSSNGIGSRSLLPSSFHPRCAVRRAHVYRRPRHGGLLPTHLCGANAKTGERYVLSHGERSAGGWIPALSPVPPRKFPDLGAWRGTSNTVSRALALIAGGALDGEAVDALAERLGVGERQLRRLFRQHLGASPIAVAQTRRVLFAKQLIVETTMPMAEVALASGSVVSGGSTRRSTRFIGDHLASYADRG